jgi:hypothetical protein
MEWVTPERLLWSAQFFRLARVALKTMDVFVTSSQLTSRLPEKRAAEETNLLIPVGARCSRVPICAFIQVSHSGMSTSMLLSSG